MCPARTNHLVSAVYILQAPADVEETDELLLWDEEMADVDPELLPRRLITDFSIYNAEVRSHLLLAECAVHGSGQPT